MTNEFTQVLTTWLGAVAALIISAMTLVSWSYETFETKEISRNQQQSIERRLERIENKIDSIRERY